MTRTPVSGVILAGGQGRRFGADKAFLEVDGTPLVALTAQKLAQLCDELLIVTNRPDAYAPLQLPARLVPDEQPGQGALMGIYSGLQAAQCSHAVVVACDMPFLSVPLLRYLMSLSAGNDVVMPRLDGKAEPLHAIYGKACLPPIAKLMATGARQIIAFLDQVRVRYVEESEIDCLDPLRLSFVNVNTPEEWERTQGYLSRPGS